MKEYSRRRDGEHCRQPKAQGLLVTSVFRPSEIQLNGDDGGNKGVLVFFLL
jgi:hypothetical protein